MVLLFKSIMVFDMELNWQTPFCAVLMMAMINLCSLYSCFSVSTGFNAAVAGCFFAVESVLWPSPTDPSSLSLSNTTSMVILSAVIASVVSEVGLGSEPAFKVPVYDFRSPTGELPILFKIIFMHVCAQI